MPLRWLFSTPELSDADWALAQERVPLLAHLDDAGRRRLRDLTARFLDAKQFLGGGGLEVTHAMKVTIAAQACLLLVGLPGDDVYPGLNTIVVHPDDYRAHQTRRNPDGSVTEGISGRLGESWTDRGLLVLSWDDALGGAVDPDDGLNVVLHEFAHQLDAADGSSNGAPVLRGRARYGAWARVLGDAYQRLREDVADGERTLLRPYGATNPAEFFAVATEVFFEQGDLLARAEPALYRELATFYGQDPAGQRSMNDSPTPR